MGCVLAMSFLMFWFFFEWIMMWSLRNIYKEKLLAFLLLEAILVGFPKTARKTNKDPNELLMAGLKSI